jgi:hypothetical protein
MRFFRPPAPLIAQIHTQGLKKPKVLEKREIPVVFGDEGACLW